MQSKVPVAAVVDNEKMVTESTAVSDPADVTKNMPTPVVGESAVAQEVEKPVVDSKPAEPIDSSESAEKSAVEKQDSVVVEKSETVDKSEVFIAGDVECYSFYCDL